MGTLRPGYRMIWAERAACAGHRDPQRWFPERSFGGVGLARAVCANCPVEAECLEYALANHIKVGVWGGLSEKERRPLRRQRRLARSA